MEHGGVRLRERGGAGAGRGQPQSLQTRPRDGASVATRIAALLIYSVVELIADCARSLDRACSWVLVNRSKINVRAVSLKRTQL